MPRRSAAPELAYWPLASDVKPILIGRSDCASALLNFHGPKNVPTVPAAAAVPSKRRRLILDSDISYPPVMNPIPLGSSQCNGLPFMPIALIFDLNEFSNHVN